MTIDEYVAKAKADKIPMIDVRPKAMYDEGHIPGAINIPLAEMATANVKPGSYLYCVTGYHANLAKEDLAKRNISAVDIGGIENYTGPVAKA
ncbi:rhodanese-like domain-containing protein [Erysipelotrichaceae bacterium RD49]|nr:rhodanese-like domain-containing protein [Erysipelotrichaceae bacterium RD49]